MQDYKNHINILIQITHFTLTNFSKSISNFLRFLSRNLLINRFIILSKISFTKYALIKIEVFNKDLILTIFSFIISSNRIFLKLAFNSSLINILTIKKALLKIEVLKSKLSSSQIIILLYFRNNS